MPDSQYMPGDTGRVDLDIVPGACPHIISAGKEVLSLVGTAFVDAKSFQRQIDIARRGMSKYREALSELAK